ncbi:MAG: hypothetical protein ACQBVK_01530 [Candidatus Phytoplasma sp. TWB_XP]
MKKHLKKNNKKLKHHKEASSKHFDTAQVVLVALCFYYLQVVQVLKFITFIKDTKENKEINFYKKERQTIIKIIKKR